MSCLFELLDVRRIPILSIVRVIHSMVPPARKMFRCTIVVVTGCKRAGRMRRINRTILVPAGLLPCVIEEEVNLREWGWKGERRVREEGGR